MQEWLLQIILGYAIKWLCKKVGLDATLTHIQNAVAKVTPLKSEENPPPMQSNNPNLGSGHYGG